jgi:poly(beta-D-mannuronate) C5 epimerase
MTKTSAARLLWCVLLVLLSIAAVAAPLAAARPAHAESPPAPHRDADGDPTPGRQAAWDVFDADSPAPDGARAPEQRAVATPAATDCLGLATRRVRYTSDGVIHLEGCGQSFRLGDIVAAGIGADKLELIDPANKIWLLKVKLKVEEGAMLNVAGGSGGDANWLRLRSDSASGIWLRAENATLLFQNTRVTSWDTARNSPDTNVTVASDGTGGRSYIATRSVLTKGRPTAPPTACSVNGGTQEPYEGRMNVVNSEIGYLGYDAAESYGMVWKVYYKVNAADPTDAPPPGRQLYALVDVFGDVSNSAFHDNYFGSYTFGGYCMNWVGNTFANNLQYGLDPHDDSDYLTISGNTFRDNGNHGVICSIECDHLVVTNNQSFGNEHGIMLHRNTNGALVEGNTSRDNRGAGIAIFDSHDAVVRNNTVANNGEAAVRLSVGASRNLFENNTLTGLAASGAGPGYVIYTFKGTDQPTSGDGQPKNNIFRNNQFTGYKSPLLKIGEATGNLFDANSIAGPAADMAFSKAIGNIVRDSEPGKSFQIKLDSSSTVTLQDSHNAIFQLSNTGLSTTVTPSGSALDLTSANAGPSVSATTLDLVIRPRNGSIAAQPTAWDAATHSWSETSTTTTGSVAHSVGGLVSGACYDVTANGTSIGSFEADGSQHISFGYSGYNGTIRFAVARSTQCVALAPAHTVLLPLIHH